VSKAKESLKIAGLTYENSAAAISRVVAAAGEEANASLPSKDVMRKIVQRERRKHILLLPKDLVNSLLF
jgi:hypothetical protein